MARVILLALMQLFAFLHPLYTARAQDAKELRVVRITPSGEDVGTTRQIVIEFNRPVVPLGDMSRKPEEVGISLNPAVACQWRWVNTSTLSCNIAEKEKLQLSTIYKLTVPTSLRAEDGGALDAPYNHNFTTERPFANEAVLINWDTPALPKFSVGFNQAVTKSSVAAHVFFEDAKTKNRTPANVFANEYDTRPPLMKGTQEARSAWVITPQKPLPEDSEIVIDQEAGLVPHEGDQAGVNDKQVRSFFTFPAFSFLGVQCTNPEGEVVVLNYPDGGAKDKCNPMLSLNLLFSSPVLHSVVSKEITITQFEKDKETVLNPWGTTNRDWSRLSDQRYSKESQYPVYVTWRLNAARDFTLSINAQKYSLWQKIVAFFKREKLTPKTALKDEFGRPLPPFTFTFSTAHRNPNYELPYRDAVLEKGIDSEVPLYVNNLKDFSFVYDALTPSGAYHGQTETNTLPDIEDVQYALPSGIRTILKNQTGAVYANLKTSPDVKKWDNAGRLFAQVTPFQVYAKLGHFSSAIWVSSLSTGAPVSNAKVTLYKGELTNLRSAQTPIATAMTDDKGVAMLEGLENIDPDLKLMNSWQDSDTRLFVRVDKDTDMALLPISHDYEVQLWNIASDVYEFNTSKYGHMKSWGMTAQGIYRSGDVMQYKIYVRNQDNSRFVAPPSGQYTLDITDPAGKVVETRKVALNDFGSFDGEYKIPLSAAVGWYSFKLTAQLPLNGTTTKREFYPLSVLVSDFTPSPFRVSVDLNGDHFKAGDIVEITSGAHLHSGGAYADAAIRTSVDLKPRPFSSKNPLAKDFYFDTALEQDESSQSLLQVDEKLGAAGEWKKSFPLPKDKSVVFGQVVIESAVRDDRGKSIAASARADYAGVDRLVGLKPMQWVFSAKKPATVQAIVVDDKGAPAANTAIDLVIEKETVMTAKVKSAGNAYLNDNTVEWVQSSTCSLTSSKEEAVDCTFTPDSTGSYRITATINDTQNRMHKSRQYLWVTGDDYVQWNEGRDYALTILPEQTDYKVGDVARYLIKNPYPDATALVTVERLGVMDSFTQKLVGSAPVIEIPVKENYVPGFYVSVVVVSPRVESPPPELGQIDLGKPAFRAGYVKTTVNDPYKQMVVSAKVDHEVYRPGDTVKLSLQARPANAPSAPEPFEMAVAVLDDSVFDLIKDGKKAFDVYSGFYDLDSLDVANYSLLTRLMGRQKFEKKGANAGGDGGVDAGMRNNFKFVSYWNPSVPLDASGSANIEFPAPDNLTGWHVLAIATTASDRMGLGEASFKVNRPTEIRPLMPNQVREGDSFSAGFSVMNRTDKPRTLKVNITASGDIKTGESASVEKTITLQPYKRESVFVPYHAALLPFDRAQDGGAISFSITAGDAVDSDGLEHTIPVLKSRTIITSALYGTSVDDKLSENISIPKDIYTDVGDVGVTLSPSVIANLDGAFKYMESYPYTCWEQKLTKAVMAAQYNGLKPYLNVSTIWEDADKIPASTLEVASAYQAPNGGMTYFKAKDEYVDPYLSAYTALGFSWLKKMGYNIPVDVSKNLEKYLMGFLRNDKAPSYYSKEMVASVRAVILSAYKDVGNITVDDIIRLRGEEKSMSLFGKAQYMQAAGKFPQAAHIAHETLDSIFSSGIESGGKFSFNDTHTSGFDRILATNLRDNCAVLSSFMDYPDQTIIKDKAFKLVRMITQSRGNRDYFENTQENMFCMNALLDYARVYESENPSLSILASYGDAPLGNARFSDVKDSPITLSKALEGQDAGQTKSLALQKEGAGRFYYTARLRYADKTPPVLVNAGMDVHRQYSIKENGKWVVAKTPLSLKRGDLVKVDLFLSLPTARNFVVVNDPLPGGLETINLDLATASQKDAGDALFDKDSGSYWYQHDDWHSFGFSRWSFYHKELRHDSARFYSDWLEAGNYHLSYMAQAIATGDFAAPPTRAQEMYDEDIFGLGEKGDITVRESD